LDSQTCHSGSPHCGVRYETRCFRSNKKTARQVRQRLWYSSELRENPVGKPYFSPRKTHTRLMQ
jgi:hypothetical protein